jgi:adenylosuccinate lyase
MNIRYTNTLISDLWSRTTQYDLWAQIEAVVAGVQGDMGIIPSPAADCIQQGLDTFRQHLRTPELSGPLLLSIDATEADVRHDVVAFLRCAGEFCSDGAPYLHYGMTSSDLVDTTLAIRLRLAAPLVAERVGGLDDLLAIGLDTHRQTPMLGRTHGQPAEPITLGLRFNQWMGMLGRANDALEYTEEVQTGKISGPVGSYSHLQLEVERRVAMLLGVWTDPGGCTQVVPRDMLARWANACAGLIAACGKIATDIRLMAARGEVQERHRPGQVGSSSMPHKHNPIAAEQICGMVRLAQGYAAMLQPIDLWEDRDISHSCVERVAVPDLLHVVCHTLEATAQLVADLHWCTGVMDSNLRAADRQPYSAWKLLQLIRDGYERQEAEHAVKEWAADGCFGTRHDHPDALALLRGNPVVFPPAVPEGIPLTRVRWEDDPTMPQPCQPIGCDHGHHLPGCTFITIDQSVDTEASGQVG